MPHVPRSRRAAVATAGALGLLALFAASRAWALRWVCDDSFISFRYARNLAEGHGLVFNAGERVEGYTNLAWTLMLAAGARAGLDPIALSGILGILFYGLLVSVVAWRSWSRARGVEAVGAVRGRRRFSHFWADRRLIPAASAAAVTLQPSSRTRRIRRARLRGVVTALLCTFIPASPVGSLMLRNTSFPQRPG